jgi:hypothetical protein
MRQEYSLDPTSPYPGAARVSGFLQVRRLLATMRDMLFQILPVHPF